jgi:hypothetical protein
MLKIINQPDSEILIAPKISSRDRLMTFMLLLCFSLPFLSVPIFSAFDYVSKTGVVKLECDLVEPKQVNCQISKSQFFDLVKTKPLDYKFVQLSEYEDVAIPNVTINGEPVFRTRLILTTKFGKNEVFENISKLTASYISYSLNSFLDSNQKSLSYNYDERFNFPDPIFPFPMMVSFFVVGGSVFWFALLAIISYEEVFLDKSNGLLRHSKNTFLGMKINRYLFNEVAKVDVLYTTDSYSNVSFTPRITINSKLQFMLDTIGDRQAAIKVANDLNRFIGLPEEEDPVVKR